MTNTNQASWQTYQQNGRECDVEKRVRKITEPLVNQLLLTIVLLLFFDGLLCFVAFMFIVFFSIYYIIPRVIAKSVTSATTCVTH